MKNYLVITGGAGFVGSNLIKLLLKKTKYKIISLDNYSSGTKKNHINNSRIIYINCNTKQIEKYLERYKDNIKSIFHFGEFARIYQSFIKFEQCLDSNIVGTNSVFKFCLKNKIKLIYSATSASLGNKGSDSNLSPYAFTKSKNLETLENLKKWFKFKFEIIYFYNVYGKNQISKGDMATVIGIFEKQFKEDKVLTVVKPGTQTRRFTHIDDTCKICHLAWKKNKNRHYSIASKKTYSIMEVAKMFSKNIKILPARKGERFASAMTDMNLSNKVYRHYGKVNLKKYISDIKKNKSKHN